MSPIKKSIKKGSDQDFYFQITGKKTRTVLLIFENYFSFENEITFQIFQMVVEGEEGWKYFFGPNRFRTFQFWEGTHIITKGAGLS